MRDGKGEAPIMSALSGIIDTLEAGLLWLLCSIPLFTAGAASTALYYCIVKNVRHERGKLSKSFFSSFKANFKLSTVIWLILLVYVAVGAADRYAIVRLAPDASMLRYLSIIFFFPSAFILPWVFAYVSRFENGVFASMKYAAYLALRHFGRTLALAALIGLSVLIVWLIPLLVFILPGALCLLTSYIIEPVFKELTAGMENDGNSDRWYNE